MGKSDHFQSASWCRTKCSILILAFWTCLHANVMRPRSTMQSQLLVMAWMRPARTIILLGTAGRRIGETRATSRLFRARTTVVSARKQVIQWWMLSLVQAWLCKACSRMARDLRVVFFLLDIKHF